MKPSSSEKFTESIRLIDDCLENEQFRAFIRHYDALLSKGTTSECLSYFGVNFFQEKPRSIKFYAHIFEEPEESALLNFIPHLLEYKEFLPKRPVDNHSGIFKNIGIVLELKFDLSTNSLSRGFFFLQHQDHLSDDIIKSMRYAPFSIMKSCIARGINFEYTDTQTLRKDYLYFRTKDALTHFNKRFAIPRLERTDFIEYAESASFSKINAYGTKLFDLSNQSDFFHAQEIALIKYLNKKFNLVNFQFGRYEHLPIKSVYFFDGKAQDTQGVLNLETLRYHLHTLNRFL